MVEPRASHTRATRGRAISSSPTDAVKIEKKIAVKISSPRSRAGQSRARISRIDAKKPREVRVSCSTRHRAGGRPRETPGRPAEVSPGPRERGRGPAARRIPRRAAPRRSAVALGETHRAGKAALRVAKRKQQPRVPGTGRVATRERSPVPVSSCHLRRASCPSHRPASSPRRTRACPPRRCPRRLQAKIVWFGSRRARLRSGRPARLATRAPCLRDRPGEARDTREWSRGSARTAGRTLAVVVRVRVWLRGERGESASLA